MGGLLSRFYDVAKKLPLTPPAWQCSGGWCRCIAPYIGTQDRCTPLHGGPTELQRQLMKGSGQVFVRDLKMAMGVPERDVLSLSTRI